MSAAFAQVYSNDLHNHRDLLSYSSGTAGTLNGATEFGFLLPYSDVEGNGPAKNGWELVSVLLRVGVNTTHSDGEITLSVEKNADGGASALATAPSILNDAGTGERSTVAAATGVTQAVVHATEANRRFADGDLAFVTLSETGSGGTDPSDVFFELQFARVADYDPELTTART